MCYYFNDIITIWDREIKFSNISIDKKSNERS